MSNPDSNPDPNSALPEPARETGVTFSGGETTVHGDVVGGDKIVRGDEIHGDKYVIAAELAYDVRGCENPYLGLSAFTYADAKKYAGREKLVAETVTRITSPSAPIPLLFVTGASGSGKSSFAQAGLLPALEKFYDGFTVKHAVMRPAGDPIAALNDALWRQLRVGETLGVSAMDSIAINPKGLEATPPNQINLLVLDQFEEFFTQSPQAARETFFAFLVNLPPFSKTRTHIIATMRADYLPELFNHSALYDIAKRGVDLRAMNAEELQQAIQQPLRASPYAKEKRFEPALVDKLAQDAAQDAAYLPLLQVTLQELWRKGSLKLEAYSNLTDAIKQRADQVLEYRDFDDATPDEKRELAQQTALLNLLLDLVDVSLDDDTRRDVRRQRTKTELTRGNPQRERWVKQLSDARLLSVEQDTNDKTRVTVDLIHETLLTNWTRLQSAIAERRNELRRRARFEQNLDEWLTQDRAENYLLEGVRLAEARELEAGDDVALRNDDAKIYLRASVARAEAAQQAELERERQRAEALEKSAAAEKLRAEEQVAANRRLQQRNLFLVGAFLLALIAVGAALFFLTKSQAETQRAEQQAFVSHVQQIASAAISERISHLGLALLLAREAVTMDPNFEARRALQTTWSEANGILFAGEVMVTSVAFSPDGRILAAGTADNKILLWDVKDLTHPLPLGELSGHTNRVYSLAFSPDGKILASGSWDMTIRLWSVSDATEPRTLGEALRGPTSSVSSLAFSPNGNILASGSCGKGNELGECVQGAIHLWNVADVMHPMAFDQPLNGHEHAIESIAFSPDGKVLASGAHDNTIWLWDMQDILHPVVLGQPLVGHMNSVYKVVFSPNGKVLVSASLDKTIRLWDVATRQPIGDPLVGHIADVLDVAFSPDGKMLASGSLDKTIRLWDVATRQPIGEPLTRHSDFVTSVVFSPDGKTLASGSADNTIRLWDVGNSAQPSIMGESLVGHTNSVSSVAFSPDSKMLASGSLDHSIRLWDVATRQVLGAPMMGHVDPVYSVAFSPDGNTVVSGSADKTIRFWDVPSREELGTPLKGHNYPVNVVTFSPDGKSIASGGCAKLENSGACGQGEVRLWDVSTRQLMGHPLIEHTDFVSTLAFHPDRQTIASGSQDKTIRLWDVVTRQAMGKLTADRTPAISSIVFSPNGSILASGGYDNTIMLWDTTTQKPLGEPLIGHTGFVSSLAFSPDGKTLASGSWDKTVRLWDVATRQSLGEPLLGHTDAVSSVAFSPNGKKLASGSLDRTIRLWDVEKSTWQTRVCNMVNRNLTRAEYAQYINRDPAAYDTDYAKNPTCPGLPVEPPPTPSPTP